MIPQVQDDIKQDFTIETLPSRTFRMNHDNLTIIGTIDEIQAVEQAVFLILNTERYEWLIHSWDYGVELHNLIGIYGEQKESADYLHGGQHFWRNQCRIGG